MRSIFLALAVAVMASSAQFPGVSLANAAPNAERGQVMPSGAVQMAATQPTLPPGVAGDG